MIAKTARSPLVFAVRHDGYVEVWTGLSASETRTALEAYAAGDSENDCGLHDYHAHIVIETLSELEAEISYVYKAKPHAWVKLSTALEEQRWRFEAL